MENIINSVTPATARYTNTCHVILALNVIVRMHGSQKKAAAELGVSPQYLNDVLQLKREPGDKILRPLGLKRRLVYERIES